MAHSGRGALLMRMARAEEALVALDRALALDPGYANAHVNRAGARLLLGRLAEAVADLDAALLLVPDDAEARALRDTVLRDIAEDGRR